MSKRYMDFVPAKTANTKSAVVSGAPRRTNVVEGTAATVIPMKPKATPKPKMVMP